MKKAVVPVLVATTNQRERINNTERLRESGLKILHVNRNRFSNYNVPVRHTNNSGEYRGRSLTIAYRQAHPGHNIEIATAIVNPNDRCFCKKIGTKTAVENFLAGHTTFVPDDYRDAVYSLTEMFSRF